LNFLVLPGDGIGPDISAATVDVVAAAVARAECAVTFSYADIGFVSLEAHGTTFTDEDFAAARDADGVILGPVLHNEYPPSDKGGLNPSGQLRRRLDLYANIRPARIRPGFNPRAEASRSTWWWCARTPKASTPTAPCSWAPAR